MSIIIQNLGAVDERSADDPMGERNYVVRINDKIITYFKHTRKDGLATCLRKAAEAVDNGCTINSIDYFLKK